MRPHTFHRLGSCLLLSAVLQGCGDGQEHPTDLAESSISPRAQVLAATQDAVEAVSAVGVHAQAEGTLSEPEMDQLMTIFAMSVRTNND